MKKLFSFLMLTLVTFTAVNAQKILLRNGDERFAKKLITADSTFRSIDSATVYNNEVGIVEATVIGLDSANAKGVTGIIKARYKVAAGTITLATSTEDLALVTDSGLTPATFQFATSGSKIYLQVKGKLDVRVHWYTTFKRKAVYR